MDEPRKTFGADAGIPKNVMYLMVAALMAVAVVGGIVGEARKRSAHSEPTQEETTATTSGN